MPHIGMRIIKSAAAVFLCFMIDLLRGGAGVPFYSAIAAVLCMQPYVSNSIKVALNRVVGTLIGGCAGMALLLFERAFLPRDWPVVQYLLVSLMVIVLIYITVLLRETSASYITCVVFMSVAVSHGMDVNPYLFAFNRILDTLIGIGVSLAVNSAHLPLPRRREILFACALDGGLLGKSGRMTAFTRIRLTQLAERGANIAVVTDRTPSSFLPLLDGAQLRLPVVCLDGAALYDIDSARYSDLRAMPEEAARAVTAAFEKAGHGCFIYSVVRDMMHVYYGKFSNPAEEALYEQLYASPHEAYVYGPLPAGCDALMIAALETDEAAGALRAAIEALPQAEYLRIRAVLARGYPGYTRLEILSAPARPRRALETLRARCGAASVQAVVQPAGENGAALVRALARAFPRRAPR